MQSLQADEAGRAARTTLREVEEELSVLAQEIASRRQESKDLAERLQREQERCVALSDSLAEARDVAR